MPQLAQSNSDFVECWNTILTPKWIRFRHLLSGNGAVHSARAYPDFDIRTGHRVLDIGCGFGETCLEIGKMVTPTGEVLGLDCTSEFLSIANAERDAAGMDHVRFELGDAQEYPLARDYFDVAFSRFGVMFFQSAVRAMKNAHSALKPGGKLCLIVWRSLKDNPCWATAKEVALQYLPPVGEGAKTCGPGPFSMADEETDRAMLKAAGFSQVDLFKRIDAEICMGRTLDEAVDFQILVGPSGEIIREAGDEGKRKLADIRKDLKALYSKHLRPEGVYLPSSTWAILATKT